MSKEEISIEEQPLCSHITTEIPIKFEPLKQEKYKYSEEEKQAFDILDSFEPDDLIECAIYRNALEKINNLIEKQQKEIEKHKNTIARYEMESKSFRAFCRKIRKTEKRNVDEFNQGREYSYIQFLNLINGEQNWEHEGKYFDEVDKELEKWEKGNNMRSKEVKNAINDLFHLQHINTYLDLNKDNFQIKRETIIEWSKSTETVLSYIEELEELPNKIRDKIKELEDEKEKYVGFKGLEFSRTGVINSQIKILKSIIGE